MIGSLYGNDGSDLIDDLLDMSRVGQAGGAQLGELNLDAWMCRDVHIWR